MSKTLPNDFEKGVDRLLYELASHGTLDAELTEEDFKRLLAATSQVSLSANFYRRAQVAISDAQSERERRNPALALGIAVSQARSRSGLELPELAGRIGISARLVEALEIGRLSIRQILRSFPPAIVTEMLAAIRLPVDEFTGCLMDLATVDRKSPTAVAARTADRQQHRDTANLIIEVSEYVAAVQHVARSRESREQ